MQTAGELSGRYRGRKPVGRISPGVTSGDWPVGLHGGGCRWCVCAGPGCAVAAPGRLGGEMYICPLCAVLGGLSGLAEGSRGIREEGEAHGGSAEASAAPRRALRAWLEAALLSLAELCNRHGEHAQAHDGDQGK